MSTNNAYPSNAKWTVVWGDETIVAPSAFDILHNIGERSYLPDDHKHPKVGISYRLFIQYGIVIDENLPDEFFLARLAEFGVITLTVSGSSPADSFQEAVDFAKAWYGGDDKYLADKGL
jgi:hypothetical protein